MTEALVLGHGYLRDAPILSEDAIGKRDALPWDLEGAIGVVVEIDVLAGK